MEDVDTTPLGVAPAGSNASYVSDDIPLAMNPGEKLNVRVTMRNDGAASPANDWSTSYFLRRNPDSATLMPFGWVYDPVTGSVATGANHDFWFTVIAPSVAGTYTYGSRMYSNITGLKGYFGGAVAVPNIVVSNATQRRWACSLVSDNLPATILPSTTQATSITVRNTGTATWPATSFCFRSRDDVGPSADYQLWGPSVCVNLTTATAPNATATFNFNITSPATTGSYRFLRQMYAGGQPSATGGIGVFDAINHCLDRTINVGVASAYDASVVSQNFPATMAPGESRVVTVVMQNAGSGTWTPPADFALYNANTPVNFWGVVYDRVDVARATNEQETFTLTIRAPLVPGNYFHRWRMRKFSNPNAGQFGTLINIPVTVSNASMLAFDATVVSQNIPGILSQNSAATFEITLQNTGTSPWTGSNFQIYSANTPINLWNSVLGASLGAAETVPVGGQKTFTFGVVSPAAAGTYTSAWRMRENGGVGNFGATATTNGIVVGDCGNGIFDPGETCEDGNNVGGDGCSSICEVEPVTIDLAAVPADRTFVGSQSSAGLSDLAIGDINNDGVRDVVMGELATFPLTGNLPARVYAGRVVAYSGVGVFSGATTSVPTASMLQVWGAEAGDRLGHISQGHTVIGDVTGDGVSDLIVSAPEADGSANGRVDCGQVYVLRGGAALGAAGTIDLHAFNPPSPLIVAVLVGRAAGDKLRVLRAGDLSGDGVADLVLGAPFDDQNGADAGAVYVVRGGATLTGTISLDAAGASLIGTALGAAAGDQLGSAASIGDVGGNGSLDLLVGAQLHAPGGRTASGGAWAIFGGPVGTVNLATTFDARWLGANNFDRLGTSVATGNVRGTVRSDVAIGWPQHVSAATAVQVGAVAIFDGPVSGTYDLSAGATPNTLIRGADSNDDAGRIVRLGDINGDGILDIPVIAALGDGPTGARASSGELSFILGNATMPALVDLGVVTPAIKIYGAAANDLLGYQPNTIAVVDIDGGSDDFCVGSYRGGSGVLSVPGRVDCFSSPF